MSQSNAYWDGISQSVQNRFADALDRLGSVGFSFDNDFKFNCRQAATNFNSATLWQVFGLAQILKREQPITVRGAFYRAVSAGLWPGTDDSYYDACGRLILKLRRLELVSYDWISDSTRRRLKPSSWSGLTDFAETVARSYRKNLWERQPDYIELFVEKDAMAGVIEPVSDDFDVTLNVIRGDCSETFIYRTAEIWARIQKPIHCYYLGDHDPKGLRIEESLVRRLEGFGAKITSWGRLAITPEDFANEDLLGFPVKKEGKPSSWQWYVEEFSDRCVEVDAIPAAQIRQRVEAAILSHVDRHEWETLQLIEAEEKQDLLSRIRSLGGEAA
jgi:hypothetical protein